MYNLFLIKDLRTQEYNTLREKDENKFYDLVDFFDKTDEKGESIFNFEDILFLLKNRYCNTSFGAKDYNNQLLIKLKLKRL